MRVLPAVVVLAIASAACSSAVAPPYLSLDRAAIRGFTSVGAQSLQAESGTGIQTLIDGVDAALGPLTRAESDELHSLYRPGEYRPLWLSDGGRPNGGAREMLTLLRATFDEGLDPADYAVAQIDQLAAALESATASQGAAERFDVAMSAAALRYFRHLHMGRVDPRAIGFRLSLPPDDHDFPALIHGALAAHGLLDLAATMTPPLVQYQALRALLNPYRGLAAGTAFEPLPPFSKAVRPGDAYAGAAELRRLLAAFGDLPTEAPAAPSDPSLYDEPLAEGVRRFQIRHGLDADGVLGQRTVAALRTPLGWRARQIELALERLRWLPHLGGQPLIALNIPMFRFWAWDEVSAGEPPLFGMNVIVGRALSTQTPVFLHEMREVVFRPYWNVPGSILRGEILPKLERDPDYLRREDMEIVAGQGDNAARVALGADSLARLRDGSLRVRQRPGPRNALGLIKFVFPNAENVYMHGTPAQALFARSRRDFSHGCVRVEDPVALAEWALKGNPEWDRERIVAAAAGSQTLYVKLARPIRVILFYTTAAVMEDGAIHFAEDIYRHDARLDRALAARGAAD